MSDINDDLFALRVALQDNIFDESYIIRRLKEYLVQNNIPDEDINPTGMDVIIASALSTL